MEEEEQIKIICHTDNFLGMNFFDILLVRLYKFYVANGERDIPVVTSILLLSIFKTFNVLSIIYIVLGLSRGKNFRMDLQWNILIGLAIVLLDFFRLNKIGGIKGLLEKYNNYEYSFFHNPVIYFISSFVFLIALRLINFFPG